MAFVEFRLLDKKTDPNSFFQNADGTQDKEKKLDYTNLYGVLNPYFILGPEGERIVKRYIAGCKLTDPIEQDKQGYKFNLANSDVKFNQGAPIILDEKKGAILIEWLRGHPMNTSSKNHDKEVHESSFFEYDPKSEIKKEVDTANAEDNALELLLNLRKNEERMKSVAVLFESTQGLSDIGEIYLGLRAIALKTPLSFSASIGNFENQILADILIAEKLNVIGKDAKAWFFEEDGGVILASTTKNRKDAEAELVSYLMSEEGKIFYNQIVIKKQQKEILNTAPAGKIEKEEDKLDAKGELVQSGNKK